MTEEQAAKVFQPFTQADSETTRKFGGTGLGLDLARRLARALGGDVELIKTASGAGSTFEVTIHLDSPSYESARATPIAKQQGDVLPRLHGVSVLLAEDSPDNQFLASKYLTMAGANVDVAVDGEEALIMALENNYDIIFMDIEMPNMDGYAATEKLRKLGYKVPIVALTAHAMPNQIEKCRQIGFDAHLSKPLAMNRLVNTVSDLLHDTEMRMRPTSGPECGVEI